MALCNCVAAAVLAGCGGSPIAAPGATPQSRTIATHDGSWMLPEASGDDLIYATFACGGTCVLSYPDGKLVGSLNVGDPGACSDASGNVYITNQNSLYEFAHGGTSAIDIFTVSDGVVNACSVDPETGNVAMAIGQTNDYNVAVFTNPSSLPTTYLIGFDIQYCGYDNAGNLFVDGYGQQSQFALYELSKSGSQFANITVSPTFPARPGQVQWDGNYLTVEGIGINKGVAIYRLSTSGSSAKIVGTTKFKGVSRTALQSWIEGSLILVPYGTRGNGAYKTKVGVWSYPAGGKVLQKIRHFEKRPNIQGVTFSPG